MVKQQIYIQFDGKLKLFLKSKIKTFVTLHVIN